MGLPFVQIMELALASQVPHGCAAQVLRAAGGKLPGHGRASSVVWSQNAGKAGRGAHDIAPDLATGLGLFIQNDNRVIAACQPGRGDHTGRPRADDGDICVCTHCSSPVWITVNVVWPCCIRMTMPSWMGVMQLCRFCTPSICTRHSKQTPIWQ